MKIKLQSGDLKLDEEINQLTGNTKPYAGQGQRSLANAITAPHGVPAAGNFSVDVSYDARMINSLDINTTLSTNGQGVSGYDLIYCYPYLPGTGTVTTVPLGYIFVIRKISNLVLSAYDSYTGVGGDFYCSAYLDVRINNSSIKTGYLKAQTGEELDTWIIADEGQTVSVTLNNVSVSYLVNTGTYNASYNVDIYGQLIEKTRASQLVISNESAGKPSVHAAGKLRE